MKTACLSAWMIVLAGAMLATGCDRPPSPPAIGGQVPGALTVTPGDEAELALVTRLETARVNYRYRLNVLRGYYDKVGNIDKLLWTRQEMENLDKVQTFQWEGAPQVLSPEGESLQNADEHLLAEYVASARNAFGEALSDLADFYQKKDPASYKAKRVRNMQERFDQVRVYAYYLSAEIPPADLKPVEVIPAADRLYEKAERLYRQGKILPGIVDYDKERQALATFRQLIQDYPRSTRIALSAYFIAEIYKEYFNEDVRAVQWYERSWQWDPNITEPARFQAATVYDFRLHHYTKALECYRASLKHDPPRLRNYEYAQQRIRELTEQPAPK